MSASNKSPEKPDLQALQESWPSPYVAREQLPRFSGGVLNPRYMANIDSKGKGPKNRVRIGRKVVYPVKDLVEWLENRSEIL